MKLYATTTSDRGGSPAKKGGEESVTTQVDTKSFGTYFFTVNEATGVATLSKIGKNERSISVIFSEKVKVETKKGESIICPLCGANALYETVDGVHTWKCEECPSITHEEY